MTKAAFVLTFSQDEVRELIANHLDDNVFSMSVAMVDQASMIMMFEPDGGLRVAGNFSTES